MRKKRTHLSPIYFFAKCTKALWRSNFEIGISTISFIIICKNQLCGELQIDWELFQIKNLKRHGVSRIYGRSNLILLGKKTSTRHILLDINL